VNFKPDDFSLILQLLKKTNSLMEEIAVTIPPVRPTARIE
jgi:hypothetical protein